MVFLDDSSFVFGGKGRDNGIWFSFSTKGIDRMDIWYWKYIFNSIDSLLNYVCIKLDKIDFSQFGARSGSFSFFEVNFLEKVTTPKHLPDSKVGLFHSLSDYLLQKIGISLFVRGYWCVFISSSWKKFVRVHIFNKRDRPNTYLVMKIYF